MTNVIDHPRKQQRIAEAKNSLWGCVYNEGLVDRLKQLSREKAAELYSLALAYELEAPQSGVSLLRSKLNLERTLLG